MTDQTLNVNATTAQCIKEASSFGYTTYTNICTGVSNRVNWGNVDYAGFIGVSLLLALVAVFVGSLLVMLIRD